MKTNAAARLHTGPGADPMPAVVWQFDAARAIMSSAPVGSDHATVRWIVNTRVPVDYARQDLDRHAAELADHFHLAGDGVTMFTAADVNGVESCTIEGVTVDVTVGIGKPTWAADPTGSWSGAPSAPGTINIVAQIPDALHHAAAVNAIITITEAKTQALFDLAVPGTGTASDAVVVCWPDDAPTEHFCGPRSRLGAPLAIATHAAVSAGIRAQHRWRDGYVTKP